MFRNLLRITSRVGVPGTLLSLGDSDGRVLYLSAEMSPVSVVVGLERDDVRRLRSALDGWLQEREDSPPFRGPAPLVAGAVGRGLADATRHNASLGTVQVRTVAPPDV